MFPIHQLCCNSLIAVEFGFHHLAMIWANEIMRALERESDHRQGLSDYFKRRSPSRARWLLEGRFDDSFVVLHFCEFVIRAITWERCSVTLKFKTELPILVKDLWFYLHLQLLQNQKERKRERFQDDFKKGSSRAHRVLQEEIAQTAQETDIWQQLQPQEEIAIKGSPPP